MDTYTVDYNIRVEDQTEGQINEFGFSVAVQDEPTIYTLYNEQGGRYGRFYDFDEVIKTIQDLSMFILTPENLIADIVMTVTSSSTGIEYQESFDIHAIEMEKYIKRYLKKAYIIHSR